MKPILFNTEMVRAILEGRKIVTRRVVKIPKGRTLVAPVGISKAELGVMHMSGVTGGITKAPYQVNDVLYVRETWNEWTGGYIYKAWCEPFHQAGYFSNITWKPSIHMPKEAARIFLKVTGVRVERLQDITNEQILAEGINKKQIESYIEQFPENTAEWIRAAYTLAWSESWNKTIKKEQWHNYYWHANPFVWVIEFEVISKEEALAGSSAVG